MRVQLLVSPQRMALNLTTRIQHLKTPSPTKTADKFDAADKSKLEIAVNETVKRFDASQEVWKREYRKNK